MAQKEKIFYISIYPSLGGSDRKDVDRLVARDYAPNCDGGRHELEAVAPAGRVLFCRVYRTNDPEMMWAFRGAENVCQQSSTALPQ